MDQIERLEKNKIEFNDKFFHGIGCYRDKDDRLLSLKRILTCGYLRAWEEDDPVYLSVYPFGKYAEVYRGDDSNQNSHGAFHMSNFSFYLILSSLVSQEPNIQPQAYRLECSIPDKFYFSKYLLGIGNICQGINHKVLYNYIITKYMKGELSDDELIILFKRYSAVWFDSGKKDKTSLIEFIDQVYASLFYYGKDRNSLDISCSATDEQLVDVGSYHGIKRIITSHGLDIQLYDCFGYLFDPEKTLAIAKDMQKYIRENKQDYSVYKKSLIRLREEMKKRIDRD